MQRLILLLLSIILALTACMAFPRAACWTDAGTTYVAVLDGKVLRLAQLNGNAIHALGSLPAGGVTTLAASDGQLLAAHGAFLLRFDLPHRQWVTLGKAPAPIRQLLPSPDTPHAVLLLTGGAGAPVPQDGAVWWVTWEKTFTCTRVAGIKPAYRPWRLWWSRVQGECRLAVATYKSTHFAPFPHNCMFLFAWQPGGTVEPRWLGSRLTRPYLAAAHAPLRGDDDWRMAAVEVTKTGGRGIGVYRPIGFGYESEWRTEAMSGLEDVAAVGNTILLHGYTSAGKPRAWRLLPTGDRYRLSPLTPAPPSLDVLTQTGDGKLVGYWGKRWRVIKE